MPRFLIEVPHADDEVECARVIEIFLKTGSHFLSKADWGCTDGEHKAWIIVDVDEKEEARAILPPAFRSEAKIVKLSYFTMDDVDEVLQRHAQ